MRLNEGFSGAYSGLVLGGGYTIYHIPYTGLLGPCFGCYSHVSPYTTHPLGFRACEPQSLMWPNVEASMETQEAGKKEETGRREEAPSIERYPIF